MDGSVSRPWFEELKSVEVFNGSIFEAEDRKMTGCRVTEVRGRKSTSKEARPGAERARERVRGPFFTFSLLLRASELLFTSLL